MAPTSPPTSSLKFRIILFALLLDAALAALVVGMLFAKPRRPATPPLSQDGKILYEVPERSTAAFLARDLGQKNLIPFPFVFKAYLALTGNDRRVRAGFYSLPPRNSAVEMAHLLTTGKMATRNITVPEGKASWEIFGILRMAYPLDSAIFDSLVQSPDFARSVGIIAPSGLEGYLFPDTYALPYRVTEREVLGFMAAHFLEVAAAIPEQEIAGAGGMHAWVTLASIVEKEAAVKKEQGLISGVFHNRLRQGWPLGADPTVRFPLRKLTGPLFVSELNRNSPYNTRKFKGLPPGPICSPGRLALLATLRPEKTEMMFFVAKDDGSKEHYFSATNPKHNKFKVLAAKNRGE